MALSFTARTGVSVVHGSSVKDTLRLVRHLETGNDLNVDIVIGVREGHPDHSALVDGLRGRGTLLPIDPACSATEAHHPALTRMMDEGNQFAWILSPALSFQRSPLGILAKNLRVVPDCAVVSPRVKRSGEPRSVPWPDASKSKAVDVDTCSWVGSLYRVSAIEMLGLPAEGDVVEGHDVGWTGRARDAGWRVMVHRRAKSRLAGVDE